MGYESAIADAEKLLGATEDAGRQAELRHAIRLLKHGLRIGAVWPGKTSKSVTAQ